MKQFLQLKLSQHLALTPQLQQSIRLLQLSTLELEQELEKYLLENPLLERSEEEYAVKKPLADETEFFDQPESSKTETQNNEVPESPAFTDEDSWQGDESTYASAPTTFDDDENFQQEQQTTTSLSDHLAWQLGSMNLPERDRTLVKCLIDALNDDGYLSASLEELAEAFPAELDIEHEELQIALNHLQFFDPTGVGARNVQECLTLQLRTLADDATQRLALKIVDQYLDLLANRDFAKLKKHTHCDDDQLRNAQHLIRSLNPRPCANYSLSDTHYIVPDVVVRKIRGQWTASLNADSFPRLRINSLYAQVLARQRGSNLAGQLQEARWLIKNVQQRFDTILRVSEAIIERQRQFLDHGPVAMRPLVLREIADALDLHESTISRVTTQKYMATPLGIFELKYFFGSHVSTDAGGACSATAIRAMIKQLIAAEPPQKPLSDSQLSELLAEQGIMVARRTVAKYRELLNIPPVKLRKII